MKKMTGSEIRSMWLEFFKSKGHEIIPSASLVPHDDPTLLWINAGVAPLKKYFDGRETPNNPRMTNAQKSIRTNDIDNVGKTARHHTFFEMLGNFSIGDYFRDEVLPWAYEIMFSEKWFNMDKNLVYITYYPEDLDTYNKWISCGVSPEHLVPIADNFWEIGEGPCGPDTEMFYDRGEKYDPNHIGLDLLRKDIENDRYIEFWNIVFSQFNSKTGMERANYPELPSKNIDTGSGLERLACISQEVETNYDSDLFMPLIDFLSNYSGKDYHKAENKMPYRVIADHIRSVTFAIADGASLSNEGRGYVLRRILRRAVRYGRKLGINHPFLYEMVDIVVKKFSDFYPYLVEKKELVEKIIKLEEEAFLKTLESGEKRLNEIIDKMDSKVLSGESAFLLYDTFGFPLELTEEVCEERGLTVDIEGFKVELNNQKERARKARSDSQSMASQNEDYLAFHDECKFVGYDTLTYESKVIAIFKDGKRVESATGECDVVTSVTPFYATMGGQIGDSGFIELNGVDFDVVETFKLPNGEHAHIVKMNDETIKVGDTVTLKVNDEERHAICSNHSGTHLLNEALRKVLGSHVLQHGSLVTPERLRFDFNHYEGIDKDQLLQIEQLVNEEIKKSSPVCTIETSIEEAKARGAQAVFGEKYGKVVRLVEMGFSKELCGGTHVSNTSEIKHFAITSLESKGSGIFRIEAVTGLNVEDLIKTQLSMISYELTVNNSKITKSLIEAKELGLKLELSMVLAPKLELSYNDFINYRLALEESKKVLRTIDKEIEQYKRNQGSKDVDEFINNIKEVNGIKYSVNTVNDLDINVVKDLTDKVSEHINDGFVLFINVCADKIIFICKSKNINKFNAGNIVKQSAIITGGNGGGRPDFAQAGGKDSSKLSEVYSFIEGLVK